MKTLIKTYLLLKSALGLRFTHFDIALAGVVIDHYSGYPPVYFTMIANMVTEAALPEAFADFRVNLLDKAEDLRLILLSKLRRRP